MKNLNLTLSLLLLTQNISFATTPSELKDLDLSMLSHCEKSVVAQMNSDYDFKSLIPPLILGVTYGTIYGTFFWASSSAVEAAGATSSTAGDIGIATPQISSTIAITVIGLTGLVMTSFGGIDYYEYRKNVSNSLSLMQFFKDIRNDGIGPQIELRMANIKRILSEKSFIKRLNKKLDRIGRQKYNPNTYKEENILNALTIIGKELIENNLDVCSDMIKLSDSIDQMTINYLLRTYNSGIEVEFKSKK